MSQAKGRRPGKPPAAPTTDALRHRLGQAEQQLREMEEESRRVTAQQNRELDVLRLENRNYQEKLEHIRMEECMAPSDLDALHPDGGKPSGGGADSKLLAANTAKYRDASELIQKKRAEAMEAAARLASARQHLSDLQRGKHTARRGTLGAVFAASTHEQYVKRYDQQTRERMRVLETHVDKESERLSAMAQDAKCTRSQIDALLFAQTRFDRNYRLREDALFRKKKEMSFLMEVCSLIYEEREHKLLDLQQLRAIADAENAQYEKAFDELNGVLEENRRMQESHKESITKLRKDCNELQHERIELEEQNVVAKEKLRRSSSRRRNTEGEEISDGDSGADQIEEYEAFFDRLAYIVDSDRLEDVVNFLGNSAEDRFRHFSEINYLQDQIKTLEDEKRSLISSFGGKQQCTAGDEAGGDSAREEEKQVETRHMLDRLNELKLQTAEHERHSDRLEAMIEKVVEQVSHMFQGLGCNPKPIQERTGLDKVLRSTVVDCLALVDQRAEEFLLAFARNANASQQHTDASSTGTAARNIIRRADLPPKKNFDMAKTIVGRKEMPRSHEAVANLSNAQRRISFVGDNAVSVTEEGPMSMHQMKLVVDQRMSMQK